MDTRRESRAFLGWLHLSLRSDALKVLGCLLGAWLFAHGRTWEGLSGPGTHALFILLFAAALWVTEAIPPFAVALLVMALQIVLLGGVGWTSGKGDWARFLAPWASPLIWLFLGGFVLGQAATKTGLDRWLAQMALRVAGTRPPRVLAAVMATTFTFSMFMSNTAATAMMLAVIAPLGASLAPGDRFRKALLLGVPIAANLGGMATLIGSPPNAIAAAALVGVGRVDFAAWIAFGLPPSVVLAALAWLFLLRGCPTQEQRLVLPSSSPGATPTVPSWQRVLVMIVFSATIGLWVTQSLHGVPTPAISFLPLVVLASTRVLEIRDVRALPWDVLLLIAGGLSLGLAVEETGLASWVAAGLPLSEAGRLVSALTLAYLTSLLSNFMSNTAAATVLVPIGLALAPGFELLMVIPIALAASSAMCLPISTPPNALAFASGDLKSGDFLRVGLLTGLLTPVLAVLWCLWWLR